MLRAMLSADTNVRDTRSLDPEKSEVCAQSRKSNVQVDMVCRDPSADVAFVSSNMRPFECENLVSKCGIKRIINVDEVQPMKVGTVGEIAILRDVQPMKVDTLVSRTSASNYNAGKSVPVCELSHEKYQSVDAVASLVQVMEASNPL